MKKWWLFLIIGLIVGFLLGLFFLQFTHIQVKTSASYGILEIVYYVLSPIGVLATVFAVIVALFGTDIKRRLKRERCIVSPVADGFEEVIADEDDNDNLEAMRYDFYATIKNIGVGEIEDCSLFLTGGRYKEFENSKAKPLNIKNRVQLYWSGYDKRIVRETILPGDFRKMLLLRINPDQKQETPDGDNPIIKDRRLCVIGYSGLDNNRFFKKGYWEFDYVLSTPHREIAKFTVFANWSGHWKKREKEMRAETSVTIKQL